MGGGGGGEKVGGGRWHKVRVDLKPPHALKPVVNCSCTYFFTCSVTYFYGVNVLVLRQRKSLLLSNDCVVFLFYILIALRMKEDISTVLKPVSLILDGNNEVTVLFPRINIDLFDRLQSNQKNPIVLVQGLRIVLQMTHALENCWIRGIHHVDLRITNVLVLMTFYSFL